MNRLAIRWLATAFGLLMAAASAVHAEGLALAAAAVSAAAVVAGVRFGAAATVAVVASAAAIALDSGALPVDPMSATLAGLCATAYLVLRHASGPHVLALPTMVGALGLAAVGYLAAVLPFHVPWLPLVAPVALFVVYAIVLRPLM